MPTVTLPFTYPDLVCELDLDPFARETTSDLQNLIQDVLHVLRELPGSNPDDPTRGVGVELYLGGTVDMFTSLCGTIERQLIADDRINSCSCTVNPEANGTFTVRIDLGVGAAIIPLSFGWQRGNFTNLSGGV